MRSYGAKKKKRKPSDFIYSKFTILLLLIILFFVARGAIAMHKKAEQSREVRAVAEARYDRLEAKRAQLEDKVAYLESDVGQESLIRNTYDVVKHDEQVIVIVDREVEEEVVEEEPSGVSRFFDALLFWR